LFGIFPVMRRSDENVWRSAAGRHAAELLVLAPWFGRSTHVTWAEGPDGNAQATVRSEEHTSELQSRENLVCRLLLEKKKDPNLAPNIILNDNKIRILTSHPVNKTRYTGTSAFKRNNMYLHINH